jgi:hypothetical protein
MIARDEDKCVQGLEDSYAPPGLDRFEQEMPVLNPEMCCYGFVPEYLIWGLLSRREQGGGKEQNSQKWSWALGH